MPLDAGRKRAGFARETLNAQTRLVRLSALAVLAWTLSAAAGAQAQQTLVIGGGPAPSGFAAGAPSPAGSGAGGGGGIEINNAVLDALGPGPASAVPLPAPQSPVSRAEIGGGAVSPATGQAGLGQAGITGAYRQPGTGALMVTRPATLLYPPMQAPKSRLTIAPSPSARAAAQAPAQAAPVQAARDSAGGTGGKLKSRLIATPPKQPLPEAPKPAAPKTAAPKPAPASAPAKPSLTAEMQAKPPAKTAKAEAPAVSGSIAPAPRPETARMPAPSAPQAPAATPAVAPPPPPPPSLPTPSVAAPSAPKVETPAPAAAQPKAVQQAARTTGTPKAGGPGGPDIRLTFASGSAELSEAAKQDLRSLAKGLAQDSASRVQLLAYAADTGDGASRARRLSLSRALAVRAFLINEGIRSTRMDVRALGSNAGDGPADRVDVLPQ